MVLPYGGADCASLAALPPVRFVHRSARLSPVPAARDLTRIAQQDDIGLLAGCQ